MEFPCNQCSKQFHHEYELIMHGYCHVKPDENKKNIYWSCNICDLPVLNEDHQKNHVAQHTKVQPYVCGRCKTKFKTETRYIHHITDPTVHLNDYKCSLCSKTLSNKANLKNHMKLHTRETKFHCKVCKKPFTRKDKLDSHEKTHSTEFRCRICHKFFVSKLTLGRHCRTVHNTNTSKIMFKCTECPKKYLTKGKLALHHQRTHKKNDFVKINQ